MTRKRNREEIENSEVDMTPMLDIVFILLIFFIVTTFTCPSPTFTTRVFR